MLAFHFPRIGLRLFRREQSKFQPGSSLDPYKWVGLALLIGITAGIGAIIFDLTVKYASDLMLGWAAEAHPPLPRGEGETELQTVVESAGQPWVLPIITTLGGLIGGILVFKLAPETSDGGNDNVIASFHYEAGQIRRRVPLIKLIASSITIGSGGSAGREGPAAHISAGFGSILANLFHLSVRERRICVLVGMGAGIGAIFRAPLGGAVLATEMLYRDDLESDAIIPALIASIASYSIFSSYAGWDPLFGAQDHIVFNEPIQLVYFAVLGVLAGLVGIIFSRTYYWTTRFFRRLAMPDVLKPAIGGLIVGLIAVEVPQTLETGYGWVQIGIDSGLVTLPLWILLLLPFLKILTTSLTVGSGASGGVFGPGMFIGAMLGVSLWRVFHDILPAMPESPASFTIIAMIAHFGAVAHVPLAMMIMVAEMTRNQAILAPAMVAVGIATFIVRNETIFRSQLRIKSDSPVHRYRYAFPLLSTLTVGEAMRTPKVALLPHQRLDQAEQLLHESTLTGAPVVDDSNRLVGILTAVDIARVPERERRHTWVSEAMSDPVTRFDQMAAMDTVFDSMASQNLAWIPIMRTLEGGELAGVLSFQSMMEAYREALTQSVRRTDEMMVGSALLEVRVSEESPLCHKPVRDLNLPDDALLVSYTRGEVVRFPHGDTVFEPGDLVGVVTNRAAEQRIRNFLEAELKAPVTERVS